VRIAFSRTREVGNDRGRADVCADAAEYVGDCDRDLDRVRVLILKRIAVEREVSGDTIGRLIGRGNNSGKRLYSLLDGAI
jgi:hypothetical protein